LDTVDGVSACSVAIGSLTVEINITVCSTSWFHASTRRSSATIRLLYAPFFRRLMERSRWLRTCSQYAVLLVCKRFRHPADPPMLSAWNLNDHSRFRRSISRSLYDASSITTVEWEKPVHSVDLRSMLLDERFWNQSDDNRMPLPSVVFILFSIRLLFYQCLFC